MQKVLVTGGLGFIGSNLVKTLKSTDKYDITVIDNLRSPSSDISYKEKNVSYIIDSILNLDNIKYKDLNFDIIYHLAGLARIQPSFKDPVAYFEANTLGTVKVCDLARRCNAKIIYAGSSSAYAGPMKNPYAYTKYEGEEICKLFSKIYNISTVTARFFNVYGPRQPIEGQYATVVGIFQRQYCNGDKITITGDGEQKRDFTHVYDIVDGLIKLSVSNFSGEIYNLGTSDNFSINELASFFKCETTYIPERPGEARSSLADITATTKDLGWIPNQSLKTYVEEYTIKNERKK
tara:strand:+ start:944 stop:1819 length:876 start_codon:yes stop_codon:yes gene_type:complete